MNYLTDRFWQMTAGFILTLFISIILMFLVNLWDNTQIQPEIKPNDILAGRQKKILDEVQP